MSKVLELKSLYRTFEQGSRKIQVLKAASLELKSGDVAALVGPSGSGKSTLLNLAGLLERPNKGGVIVDGHSTTNLSDAKLTAVRNTKLGFVFQFHHLLPEFTAVENAAMPLIIQGMNKQEAEKKAAEVLEKVGLKDRLSHRPAQLSGGEQQRVAVARAVIHSPAVVLADEPTGNLDTETSDTVFNMLVKLAREEKIAVLMATHNPNLAAKADHKFVLDAGKIKKG